MNCAEVELTVYRGDLEGQGTARVDGGTFHGEGATQDCICNEDSNPASTCGGATAACC